MNVCERCKGSMYGCLYEDDERQECDDVCMINHMIEGAERVTRKKVLEEVLEIAKTIEAADILARAKACDQNCNECDGCLTRILFGWLEGELT